MNAGASWRRYRTFTAPALVMLGAPTSTSGAPIASSMSRDCNWTGAAASVLPKRSPARAPAAPGTPRPTSGTSRRASESWWTCRGLRRGFGHMHDEHGHVARLEDTVAHAPEQQRSQLSSSTRSHHDEVVVAGVGLTGDLPAGCALLEDLGDREVGGYAAHGPVEHGLILAFELLADAIDVDRHVVTAHGPDGGRGRDGHHRQRPAVGLGQIDGFGQRPLGVR